MSDQKLLLSVEELIGLAMGQTDQNTVNFKIMQTILHILARQMRILETKVEIIITEEKEIKGDESSSTSSGEVVGTGKEKGKHAKTSEKMEQKEKEKLEKMSPQEREKYEKEKQAKEQERMEKEREKAAKMEQKEKEMLEKMSPIEREKYETKKKEKEKDIIANMDKKEKAKFEKMSPKEREHYIKDKVEKAEKKSKKAEARSDIADDRAEKFEGSAKRDQKDREDQTKGRKRGHASSSTGISVKDHSRGSIDVVTQSEFELLEAAVKELQNKAGPLPSLAMPDNVKLKADLTRGSASLTDTMQAMQVDARVKAAEQTIDRLAGLLTQLAAAGAIPSDAVTTVTTSIERRDKVDFGGQTSTQPSKSHKSVAIASTPSKPDSAIQPLGSQDAAHPSVATGAHPMGSVSAGRSFAATPMSVTSRMARVTQNELDEALKSMKENLLKNVTTWTNKAAATAELAFNNVKDVSDKLGVAFTLDKRISTLHTKVEDSNEILQGFDAGLSVQMQCLQEQMAQINSDLQQGLKQLEDANENMETAAVMELRERYEGLVSELERTMSDHQVMSILHSQLGDELKNAIVAMELLREQKADRDEVMDGLKDKADISRLDGLLSEKDFAIIQAQLEHRLELCYTKFYKQDQVWMTALKDLSHLTEDKAAIAQLLSLREETQNDLRDLHDLVHKLEEMLGEPKAALLIRKLARDASCGACMTQALMNPTEPAFSQPLALPAALPAPPAEIDDDVCYIQKNLQNFADKADALVGHVCNRWCGGSHTLVSGKVRRERAAAGLPQLSPRKRYIGLGADGRPYLMDEELQPCAECNVMSYEAETKPEDDVPPPRTDGAGDLDDSHRPNRLTFDHY